MICHRLEDAIDPRYKFIVYRDARDDVEDDVWAFTETEQEAKYVVEGETKEYDSPDYTFNYSEIRRR
jgi:hypothetical protein